MGVQGLWTVVQPCARPTNLATLNRKRLAVDASIWIYQFLKAVRDKEGNALRNSHIVGFFRRLCKLLWYGVKPVFVFDGGAPALKRATLQGRRRRREGRREDAARTAGKLLAVQMHRLAEEEEEKRQRRVAAGDHHDDEEQEELPSMENIVYADELGLTKQERQRNRKFHKQDAYHLPELQNGIEAMGKPDDPRIMSVEELEEYARQFNSGENIDLYDFSKIDFDGEFFKSLPPADRYNILNAARLRSRLRMGLSKEQLDAMFPDRMAFSKFQIERVKERNHLTQRLMFEMGMNGTDLTVNPHRVAGDRGREYILVKNEGAEGGWALGVVTRDKDTGKAHQPIDVDALDFQYQNKDDEDEWEDEEFEDVPIEGLNRLPRISDAARAAYERAQELGAARQRVYNLPRGEESEDDEALFVNEGDLVEDEDEDLNRAIAMSLEKDHGVNTEKDGDDEDEEFEDVPAPKWTQRAAPEVSRPIANTSGSMIAHIVNNRANAAVKRPTAKDDSDSDSDGDLQSALAAARKKQPKPKPVQRPNVKNPFDGPLPFEKLDWRTAFGGSKSSAPAPKPTAATETIEKPRQVEIGDLEAESDEEAGGFVREPAESTAETEQPTVSKRRDDDKPLPLPPWLTDNTDITESVRRQQQIENQQAAEDEELAQFRQLQRRKEQFVEIESSSDDDSDFEILDAPPVVQTLLRAKSPPRKPGASLPSLQEDLTSTNVLNDADKSPTPATRPETEELESSESPMELDSIEKQSSEAAPPTSAPNESEDEDMEFEDVVLPSTGEPSAAPSAVAIDDHSEAFLDSDDDAPNLAPSQQPRIEGPAAAPDPDDIYFQDDEYDEFYDPEEEELLARMAEEAEEHARFASQLNNKTQRENQEAYEQELRALRTQQKKDRRDADEVTQIMVTECQALLRLFGIPYITAPMEAEAQCAELVRLSLVDGIVTDDSDIFLFGGTRVYKNMFNSNKFVECYLLRDLEDELSLPREQLIALAQLLGSDYTEGIPGIGPVTAVEILSEFPGREGLAQFKEWWDEVQSGARPKEADASSPFRRRFRKSQATKLFLPLGFPSPPVFDAYLHPEADSSQEPFQWGVPDLEGLRVFLMSTVGWSKERTDEVLVPVIRDVNKREAEGTQANITRYFEGGVGSGTQREAFAPRRVGRGGSRRMAEAVGRLKAKKSGLSMELPVAVPKEKGKGRKRKAREVEVEVVEEGEGGEGGDAVEEVVEEGDDEGGAAGSSSTIHTTHSSYLARSKAIASTSSSKDPFVQIGVGLQGAVFEHITRPNEAIKKEHPHNAGYVAAGETVLVERGMRERYDVEGFMRGYEEYAEDFL
ncbi:hypothetical protein QBC40DRAFT_260896 [Triangularia verruculosa]|uniref:Uncharacterized protein n=1 Tax=Triangularia verruculosa TaxID=2587418 RepID=A0AAN6XT54_9PEZI|nr:hypothetical protein QBC40DRAFT_260896 [Triangularia verruculosa]